jgi:hypothetical protein
MPASEIDGERCGSHEATLARAATPLFSLLPCHSKACNLVSGGESTPWRIRLTETHHDPLPPFRA